MPRGDARLHPSSPSRPARRRPTDHSSDRPPRGRPAIDASYPQRCTFLAHPSTRRTHTPHYVHPRLKFKKKSRDRRSMDGSDTPGRRPTLWVTTHQSPPPHTHRVAENPASDAYAWMTARDRADDGTARRPTVRPFFLYRGLLATSHRSVHPPAPVRGKIHASHDRPRDRADARCGRGGRARGDRPTDRPVRCPRWRARRMTTRRRVDIERRAARGDARASTR